MPNPEPIAHTEAMFTMLPAWCRCINGKHVLAVLTALIKVRVNVFCQSFSVSSKNGARTSPNALLTTPTTGCPD